MKDETFYNILQRRIAGAAITPSAARRMLPAGTIRLARASLTKVSLTKAGQGGSHYPDVLDEFTELVILSFPKDDRSKWGAARKFVNIFMRDATYNYYLRQKYSLQRIEKFLEVPIDSHVAEFLRESKPNKNLPRWKSVISLTRDQNDAYQQAAREFAFSTKINPVDVDVLAWRKHTGHI